MYLILRFQEKHGEVIARYEPTADLKKIAEAIEILL